MLQGTRPTFRRASALSARPGTILWLLCFQFFIAEQTARFACTTPYSMRSNVISDLGAVHCGPVSAAAHGATHVVCSPLYWLMNGSFMLQGLLIFFGAILLRRFFPGARRYTVALVLLAISGLGVLVVGLAPEDVHPTPHILGAAANFIGGGLGMLLVGIAILRDGSASRTMGWLSVIAGTICLLATAMLTSRGTAMWSGLNWGVGTVERFAAYPLPMWLTGMGYVLLTRATQAGMDGQRETVE